MEGLAEFEPGSVEFIQEVTRRALSGSELGHIAISDRTEGAKFTGDLGEGNQNFWHLLRESDFCHASGGHFLGLC